MTACLCGVALAGTALGDDLLLADGRAVKGTFTGYHDRRFTFETSDGKSLAELASNVRAIAVDSPPQVAAGFVNKQYNDVQFKGLSRFTIRLLRNGEVIDEPVVLLKSLDVAGHPVRQEAAAEPETPVAEPAAPDPGPAAGGEPVAEEPVKPAAGQVVEPHPAANGVREWKRSGKWREVESAGVDVISQGEEVDIEALLKKGVVNVVHFHLASVHSSVRQGNYVETLADKSRGRIAIRRVNIPDWKAPVCAAMELKSLPQFWFYSRTGRPVKKLTERFTEADIDAAMKEALRAP